MLIHALILSLLLSLPTATLAYALSSELSAVAWACAVVSSVVCVLCAYKEFRVMCAVVNGRVARAAYRPPVINRVIEHNLPLPPVVLPVAPERLRFIPIRNAASYLSVPLQHSAKSMFASEVTSPVLQTPTSHGVDTRDLTWFVSGLSTRGSHSRRQWEGKVAPSGRVIDAEYHAALITPLVVAGCITGRGERRAGSLVSTPTEMLALLELG